MMYIAHTDIIRILYHTARLPISSDKMVWPIIQLSSSNQSGLLILNYQQPVTYTSIIDLSVCTYDSALSFLVICVKCYIGPCGVLVPIYEYGALK